MESISATVREGRASAEGWRQLLLAAAFPPNRIKYYGFGCWSWGMGFFKLKNFFAFIDLLGDIS